MTWLSLREKLNSACLDKFSETGEIIFTPRIGPSETITGILEEGIHLEGLSPGVYALLSVKDSTFTEAPRGEITVSGRIYKILEDHVQLEQGMYKLLLRFHREVIT